MMRIVTAAQMRRIDEITIRERGVPGRELMERAGAIVARETFERFEPGSAAIVTGKGNNGGDGFVAARHLRGMGVAVHVFALADPSLLRGDALSAFEDLPPGIPVELIIESDVDALAPRLCEFDVIIDAILGTGTSGPATGLIAGAIEAINAARVPVVAVDIPSGLPSDVLAPALPIPGAHVRAAVTVTIGLAKLGLVLDPGLRASGVVTVADIGFPQDLLDDPALTVSLVNWGDAAALLPPRPPWGNKGTFGRAMILAGSPGMTGAAVLAARAAMRSGAGLVYAAYPAGLGSVIEPLLIEAVKLPLDSSGGGWFAEEHLRMVLDHAAQMDAVAIGPGLGLRAETARFALEAIASLSQPLVIDADALNAIGGGLEVVRGRKGATILTPHPGEAARLLKTSVAEIETNRLDAAFALSRESGAIVVLKGSQTIVAEPGGQRFINPTGNSGLSKGGSGDVLTGLIAGLLAQGCAPLAAAQLGTFLHGLAADEAARSQGVRAMLAGDVIESFGEAFKALEKSGRG